MRTMPDAQLVTADELLRMSDREQDYELVRGRLISVSPATSIASMVAVNVLSEMHHYARDHRLGRCGGADWGFRLSSNPDTVRAPDAALVSGERIPAEGIPEGYWEGAPDLAVEVRSPNDRPSEILTKVAEYLTAGTRLVWTLDPARHRTVVYRADGSVEVLGPDGELDGEDVLPGFRLPLANVWV